MKQKTLSLGVILPELKALNARLICILYANQKVLKLLKQTLSPCV